MSLPLLPLDSDVGAPAMDDVLNNGTVDPFAEAQELPPDAEELAKRPVRPIPLAELFGLPMPRALLRASGRTGAVLTSGSVTMLAGEGGVAKSSLALGIAIGMASLPDRERGTVAGIFEAYGGAVLMATWEDAVEITGSRGQRLVEYWDGANESGAAHRASYAVHVLPINAPLFGPAGDGSYNRRPQRLDGWIDLEAAALDIRPSLMVIDPALSAYVGEPNSAAPVREFLTALARLGKEIDAGILLVAHSRKDARSRQRVDLVDPGHIGGSAAWVDGARGALTLTQNENRRRMLTISKANYGPSFLTIELEPIVDSEGHIAGLQGNSDGWRDTRTVEAELRDDTEPPLITTGSNRANGRRRKDTLLD